MKKSKSIPLALAFAVPTLLGVFHYHNKKSETDNNNNPQATLIQHHSQEYKTKTPSAFSHPSPIEIDIEVATKANYDLLSGNDTASPDSIEELVETFVADFQAQSTLYCKEELGSKVNLCSKMFSEYYLPARFQCENMHDQEASKKTIKEASIYFLVNQFDINPTLPSVGESWICIDNTFVVQPNISHENWLKYQQ